MSTLLLRLAGPMQSWGTQSRFSVRDTGLEPSKSGVIGLLCAALGLPRHETVDHLAALIMGVRVDFEGALKRDYHTAGGSHRRDEPYGAIRASGQRGDPVPSPRYYLADADFLIGLEGEDESLLQKIHYALKQPRWQLFLGRKAFVPSVPVFIPEGLKAGVTLGEALTSYPWPRWDMTVPPKRRWPDSIRLAIEAPGRADGEVRMDQPTEAAFETRRFLPRGVVTEFKTLGTDIPVRTDQEAHYVPFTPDTEPQEQGGPAGPRQYP